MARKKNPFTLAAYAANDNGGNLLTRKVPVVKSLALPKPKLVKLIPWALNKAPYTGPDFHENDN